MKKLRETIIVSCDNKGNLALALRAKHPDKNIVCNVAFPHHVPALKKMGFKTYLVKYEKDEDGKTVLVYDKELYKMIISQIPGNPPYQELSESGKSKPAGSNSWGQFLKLDMDLLSDGGILGPYLTPPSWMSPGDNNDKTGNEIFYKYQILSLELGNAKDFGFSVGSLMSMYRIEKTLRYKQTHVVCQYRDKKYISNLIIDGKRGYLPRLLTKDSLSILDKCDIEDKMDFVRRCDYHTQNAEFLSKEKDSKHPYDVAYTKAQPRYSSKKQDIHGKKKVVIHRSGDLHPIYDKGNLSVAQEALYKLVSSKKEGEYILRLLNSKLYRFIIEICKYSGFHHPVVLQNLPYPKGLKCDFTDNQLYKYFKLTKSEIDLIEDVMKK